MNSHDSTRRVLAGYPIVRKITTRASDLDGYGHFNAIRIGHFYEDARAAFYGMALEGVERPRLLVVQLTMQYLAEGFWPGDVVVGTGVSKVGRSSFEMSQALFQDDRCLGLCETVVVHADSGRARPLPDEVRARLTQMRAR